MNIEHFISCLHEALAACDHPRYFETERGFQGKLLVELERRMHIPDQAIIEQEYQKRLKAHGLTSRPDIVIHEPYDSRLHAARDVGNLVVIELKLKASKKKAKADLANLARMLDVLHYKIGVFINIGASETHAALLPAGIDGHIISFAVFLRDGRTNVLVSQIEPKSD